MGTRVKIVHEGEEGSRRLAVEVVTVGKTEAAGEKRLVEVGHALTLDIGPGQFVLIDENEGE